MERKAYHSRSGVLPYLELIFGSYFLFMVAYSIDTYNFLAVPILLLFVGGYYWASCHPVAGASGSAALECGTASGGGRNEPLTLIQAGLNGLPRLFDIGPGVVWILPIAQRITNFRFKTVCEKKPSPLAFIRSSSARVCLIRTAEPEAHQRHGSWRSDFEAFVGLDQGGQTVRHFNVATDQSGYRLTPEVTHHEP